MALQAVLQTRSASEIGQGREVATKLVGTVAAPRINFQYDPEPKNQSTKIVFIQVMQGFLDGVAVLPSQEFTGFRYRDPDTTLLKFHVDYVAGEKDPYYNGDDKKQDIGAQGNATSDPKISATMFDAPNYPDASFPAGKSKIRFEFKTAAFSAAGADQGVYYQYVAWVYEKEKGKTATLALVPAKNGDDPPPEFKDAVNLWCKNHGFHLPTPAPPAPTPPAPKPGSKVNTYVVVSGDYLSKIAQKFYGNGNLWPKIYDANKAVIGGNPNLIYPGQILVIP